MEECSICKDPLLDDKGLPSIDCPTCKHKFHMSCIIDIIKFMSSPISVICPLCRATIFNLDKVESIIKKQRIVLKPEPEPEASWRSDLEEDHAYREMVELRRSELQEHRQRIQMEVTERTMANVPNPWRRIQEQQRRETRGQGTLTLVIGAATISGVALTMLPPHIGTTIAAMSAAFTIWMVFDPNLRGGTRRKKSIKRLKRGGNKFITGEIDFSLPNPLNDFLGKIDKLNKQYAGKEILYCIKFEHIDLETSKMLLKMLTLDIPIHVSKI